MTTAEIIATTIVDVALLGAVSFLGVRGIIPPTAVTGLLGAAAGASISSGQGPAAAILSKLRAPKKV